MKLRSKNDIKYIRFKERRKERDERVERQSESIRKRENGKRVST